MKGDSPGYEGDFVPFAAVIFLKLKVIDRPSTFILWQG